MLTHYNNKSQVGYDYFVPGRGAEYCDERV